MESIGTEDVWLSESTAMVDHLRRSLEVAEARFHNIIERSADGVLIVNEEGVVIFVNAAGEAVFNRSRQDLLGQAFGFPVLSGMSEELEVIVSPGETAAVDMRVVDTEWQGKPAYLVTLRDVTERRRAEQALLESEEKFRSLFETALDAILVADENGRYLDANPQALALLGYSREELLAMTVGDLTPPEDHAAGIDRYRRFMESGRMHGEYRLVCKDGRVLDVEFSAAQMGDGRYQSMLRDITERKRVEQFREEYISLISHDLRNPLTPVMGHASWLVRRLADLGLEQEARSAESILQNSRQINVMIQDLVQSANLESGALKMDRRPTDICQLVADLMDRIGTAEDRTRLHLECFAWISPVLVDPSYLERAVTNLITNALKYSPSEEPVVLNLAESNGEVVLTVSDRGVGIPPDEIPHLFQRFYRARTSQGSDGLGLGLYITRLVVEAHGGRIEVESEAGSGSRFRLVLPSSRNEEIGS